MNKNIFSPKGEIDELFFIINYIALLLVYIIGGYIMIVFAYKNNWSSITFLLPLMLLKILILFNYKKRVMNITKNLKLSIIFGFILTFLSEGLTLCGLIKNTAIANLTFWICMIVMLLLVPAIVALIPAKKES